MGQKGYTKDELYLLKLYQMAIALGDPLSEIDRYEVGRAIGQNDRGVNAMTRHLLQANFLKKGKGDSLYLTSNGLTLVQLLSEE